MNPNDQLRLSAAERVSDPVVEEAFSKSQMAVTLCLESGWTGPEAYDKARRIVDEGPERYAKALKKAKRKREKAQREGTPDRMAREPQRNY